MFLFLLQINPNKMMKEMVFQLCLLLVTLIKLIQTMKISKMYPFYSSSYRLVEFSRTNFVLTNSIKS